MIVTKLKTIEENVNKNKRSKAQTIKNFQKKVEKENLRKGRVRPRNKTEERILNSFKRK